MQAILAVTVPFFALVLCGYLAAQRRVLPESAIPGLNTYVLFFALPCMLFRFGSSMPFAQLIDPLLIAIYGLSALLMVFFTVAATWRRHPNAGHGVDLKNAAFGALVAAFPNTGFMGVPLLVALFAASGRALPGPINQIVKMLGDSATPVALFTIGSVLWRAGQHAHSRTAVRDYLPVALFKLLIHPALVFSLGLLARGSGLAVPPFGLTVLVLAAALPSASNVSLLAERYGADNGRVARIIMASTVLAFGTFSLLAWQLGANH